MKYDGLTDGQMDDDRKVIPTCHPTCAGKKKNWQVV